MSEEVTEFDLRRPEFQDPMLKPEDFEFDGDGNIVRKDRFEKLTRKLYGGLCELKLMHPWEKWTPDQVWEITKGVLEEYHQLKNKAESKEG
ncbi:hypothetical protein IEC338SC_3103 [Acinetobacter pittii]|uniref:Uncharacterized protein n=1 Tax=Acinetobacter pittii TaxID=48296 RepID=A0AB33BMT0_ACIPI|nr:hypothetical protein [Acinetobacter pittii]AMX20217.1 hypothetical protein IEC338SC_3103 [Acinetobacter pittii]